MIAADANTTSTGQAVGGGDTSRVSSPVQCLCGAAIAMAQKLSTAGCAPHIIDDKLNRPGSPGLLKKEVGKTRWIKKTRWMRCDGAK